MWRLFSWAESVRQKKKSREVSCFFMEKGYVSKKKDHDEIRFEGLRRGEKIDFPQKEDITPLSVFVTYSYDEMMSQTQTMRIDFYWRQVLGVNSNILKKVFSSIDYRKCPLIFLDYNPLWINIR